MAASWQTAMQEIKRAVFRLPGVSRVMIPRYPFMVQPDQLIWLCQALDRTREARARAGSGQGCIVEVGVARGQTSSFLLTHMRHHGDNRPYCCIDTFQGFTPSDVAHEVDQRGKSAISLRGFAVNDRALIEQSLKRQGFSNVVVIEADAGRFEWSNLPPVDVMLIDVDLYRPTKAVLVNSQPHWAPFAHVMVDDVKDGTQFDGAHQAYTEFCNEQHYPPRMIGTKAGVLVADQHAGDTAPPLADVSLLATTSLPASS
jgi:hypothetical protein